MDISKKIEAILFYKGEPMKIKEIARLLNITEAETKEALNSLKESLNWRGIVLLEKEDSYALRTSAEASDVIEQLRKDDLSKDIGKAALEIVSILLYKGPTARSEIDYIRGVNSTFTLRNLMIRGLIERIQNPKDARSFLYKPSFDLMSFLGISKIEDMPDYSEMKEEISNLENRLDEEMQNGENTTTT